MRQYPTGFGRALAAAEFYLGPSKEIAIIGDPSVFSSTLRKRYLPRAVLAGGSGSGIPLLRDRPMVDGKPTVYVCENFVCKQPVTDPVAFDAFEDGLAREASDEIREAAGTSFRQPLRHRCLPR